ncbi:stalk domain-containing protein [Brevibacillus massiliensis]|jgi:peptidoglycan/xylan/chitin deacetylase (PgdA/CDA1 family)|uniref:stalk domain-containing protein n=1 Tax=Brevibacillus massiliensis TaxID=1118054 RepID=UPI0002E08239|nr:stalk domain-containing protein [Brevibacillus massiliensis]
MKKITSTLLAGFVILSGTWVSAAANSDITLMINGQKVQTDIPLQMVKGRTLAPVRAVAEHLGASVKWDENQHTVFITKGNQKPNITNTYANNTNEIKLVINGKEVKSDVPPVMIGGSTMVPVRTIAEELGSTVEWNEAKHTVWIANRIINPAASDFHGQAMITFSYDDGLDSFYDRALPLHEKYGIPATLNVIAERIKDGANTEFLEAAQIKDAYDRGVEIGSHTYSHYDPLTSNTDDDLDFELAKSKEILLGIVPKVDSLSIPFSAYDHRVREAAKKYYKAVRVFEHQQNNLPPDDPYWLHSAIAVTNEMTFDQIKLRIDEAVQKKKWCIIMLHGIDPNDDDLYEIKPELLEQTLEYVNNLGRDKILPVNTMDGLTIATQKQGK